MKEARRGWLFVAVQAVLIGALIVMPSRNDWATPPVVRSISYMIFLAGVGLAIAAALGLGRSLTATPVPSRRSELTTGGLYRFMRHPIYTGVLAIVAGMTLRSGSWPHVVVAVVTVVFFDRKANWEERRLAERYEGYPAYAERTPRFVPRPWRSR